MSLGEEHVALLKEKQEAGEAESRSDALRQILDEYERVSTEYDELHTECENLRTRLKSREERIGELETQLSRRSQLEDKIEDLPDKIRDREGYQERRQRLIDQASLAQRLKWKMTGVPVDKDSGT